MKTRWAEEMCVSSGVMTVRKPHADAERRRTFSPPILEDRKRALETSGGGKGKGPQPKFKHSSRFSCFLRENCPSNLFFSS